MDFKSTIPLSGLFRSFSSIRLQEPMRRTSSCFCQLPLLLGNLYRKDYPQLRKSAHEIFKLVSGADEIKQKYRANLLSTLLLFVDREDKLSDLTGEIAAADGLLFLSK